MENIEINPCPQPEEIQTEDIQNDLDSAENFQKFIYDLFDKNGILNDLRAYLRGHIVNVLNSAQTGDPPICQRHFTQRLELTSQALNILVAEYLLCFEFSYSLSVFVSEIPLANMVFDFSKSLLQNRNEITELRFTESDVWSILNYLGIKCDSDHASSIAEMYKSEEQQPLLLCILKCVPMYRKPTVCMENDSSSTASQSLSEKSSEHIDDRKNRRGKCAHYSSCNNCRHRVKKLREKYKKKKKYMAKNETSINPLNGETLMKNINCMERGLIDEMFHNLKEVYEKEVDMVREEDEGTVKRSLASHALVLQKRQDEMEQAFAAREAELHRSVHQKKRFLWGLANALRDQHRHMARAMRAVRTETDRLTAKEESLKTQLIKAEEILRKRGQEMRSQISNELVVLEGHLESMKSERNTIHQERSALEQLKSACESNKVVQIQQEEPKDNPNIQNHYDLLKNELAILKKYLEATKLEPKCVTDRGTLTDLSNLSSKISIVLNNEQDAEKFARDDDRGMRPPNQVVNDFKKQKNVNFSQSNLDEVFGEASRGGSRSTVSSDGDELRQLREENIRLKILANQQRSQLEAAKIAGHCRPRTAPPAHRHSPSDPIRSVNPIASASSLHWPSVLGPGPTCGSESVPGPCFGAEATPCGAGEQLRAWPCTAPLVLQPEQPLPFIDARADSRRHLISQWRSLRQRRLAVGKLHSPPRATDRPDRHKGSQPWTTASFRIALTGSVGGSVHSVAPDEGCSRSPEPNVDGYLPTTSDKKQNRVKKIIESENCNGKNREKSPKSVLKEAKEKLKNYNAKCHPPTSREKSPTCVLREAKLRLRKLEIEAEAVERSYRDFRMRQQLKGDRSLANEEAVVTKDIGDLGLIRSKSLQRLDRSHTNDPMSSHYKEKKDPVETLKSDFDKYLREYHKTVDIGETRFKNKNSAAQQVKPIPQAFSNIKENEQQDKPDNYIETPLTEFRKLYHSQKTAPKTENVPLETKQREKRESSPKSPKTKLEDRSKSPRSESPQKTEMTRNTRLESIKIAIVKTNSEKKAELEILKQNISKMYNLQQPINTEVPPRPATEMAIVNEHSKAIEETVNENEQNLLRIEVETVKEVNKVQIPNLEPNLLVEVQSEVDATDAVPSESEQEGEKMSVNMTILISPKRSDPTDGSKVIDLDTPKSPERSRRSESPEQAAMLTRNDVLDAIFHVDTMKEASSHEMRTEIEASKEHVGDCISEAENAHDYVDDFSADVDNYSSHYSRSEFDISPVSVQKTSEDENFWDI